MKILFICGSSEPGQDGVGDYTRRLAEELLKIKISVGIVSLFDNGVDQIVGNLLQNDQKITTGLRIPINYNNFDRYLALKNYIDKENPDWISLQFVTFSFHRKGLPFHLARELSKITYKKRCHIMFHELWVGMEKGASLKLSLWGIVQKWIIKHLLVSLRPDLIHTQTSIYKSQLKKLGYDAGYLPLFSNIPTIEEFCHPQEEKFIATMKQETIHLVVFGSIHPGAPMAEFSEEASLYCEKYQIRMNLRFLGRCGEEQKNWVKIWEYHGLTTEILGEQTPEGISTFLNSSSIGIATTPYALSEKSGSIAAMLDHGLPVISVSKKWVSKEKISVYNIKGIYPYTKGSFSSCIAHKNAFDSVNVSEVANQLVAELKNCGG